MNAKILSFNCLREANLRRLPEFKNNRGQIAHSHPEGRDWTPAQWLQAIVGELGEYANFRKKYERLDIDPDEFLTEAKRELADVVIYLDILSHNLGINLGEAVREKFNATSLKAGSTVRITPDDQVIQVDVSSTDWINYVYDQKGNRINHNGRPLFKIHPTHNVGSDFQCIHCLLCQWEESILHECVDTMKTNSLIPKDANLATAAPLSNDLNVMPLLEVASTLGHHWLAGSVRCQRCDATRDSVLGSPFACSRSKVTKPNGTTRETV